MSVAIELSSEVAIAFFSEHDVEKTEKLLGIMLKFQDTLRALSNEERRSRHARFFHKEPPRGVAPTSVWERPGN